MKKKRNAVILWKKRNNYGKNVMVGTSVYGFRGDAPHINLPGQEVKALVHTW